MYCPIEKTWSNIMPARIGEYNAVSDFATKAGRDRDVYACRWWDGIRWSKAYYRTDRVIRLGRGNDSSPYFFPRSTNAEVKAAMNTLSMYDFKEIYWRRLQWQPHEYVDAISMVTQP